MSMDDPTAEPDEPRRAGARHGRRWPLSTANTVLVIALVVVAIAGFAAGRPLIGVPMLLGGSFGVIGILLARRASAGDLERVNAMEYADERERAVGVKGLAAVGAAAMILWFAQLLGVMLLGAGYPLWDTTLWGFLALCVVWFAANWFFIRRG